MLAFYITCLIFVVGACSALILRFGAGMSDLRADALPGPGVPADRLDRRPRSRRCRGWSPRWSTLASPAPVVGIVVPTGYSFNLDGTAIYLTMASLFIADAMGRPLSIGEQISLLLFMMIASKGAAGVTGAGLATAGRRPAVASTRSGRRRRPDRRDRPVHVRGPRGHQLFRQRGGHSSDGQLGRRVRFGPGQACAQREDPFDEATMIDDEEPPVLAEHPLPGHTAQPVKVRHDLRLTDHPPVR